VLDGQIDVVAGAENPVVVPYAEPGLFQMLGEFADARFVLLVVAEEAVVSECGGHGLGSLSRIAGDRLWDG